MNCPLCGRDSLIAVCTEETTRYREVFEDGSLGDEVRGEDYGDEFTHHFECDNCVRGYWETWEDLTNAYNKE